MAIWTGIHGRNGLLNSRPLEDKDYLEILNSIPLDENKILDSILEFNVARETVPDHRLKEHDAYVGKLMEAKQRIGSGQKSEWRKRAEHHYRNDVCYFGEWGGLGFTADNDLLDISGPMFIFGSTPCFQKSLSKISREYYHHYFKSILMAFKSDFILYAPEWYGICDGDTETKSVSDLLALENWREKSGKTLHAFDYVYFEELEAF